MFDRSPEAKKRSRELAQARAAKRMASEVFAEFALFADESMFDPIDPTQFGVPGSDSPEKRDAR